jgi:hypothetical protein
MQGFAGAGAVPFVGIVMLHPAALFGAKALV